MLNNKFFLSSLFFFSFLFSIKCWEILSEINPFCENYPNSCNYNSSKLSAIDLVHSKSYNDFTSFHFFSSTLRSKPGFLILEANKNDTFKINWDEMMNKNCSNLIFPNLKSFIALEFSEIIFVSNKSHYSLHLQDIFWENISNHTNCSPNDCEIVFITPSDHKILNGTIRLTVKLTNKLKREKNLPKLLYSPSMLHIELFFTGLNLPDEKFRPMIMLMISSNSPNEEISVRKSNNDQNTPGVFETHTVRSLSNEFNGSFVLWKPIAYFSNKPKIDKWILAKTMVVDDSKLNLNIQTKPSNKFLRCFLERINSTYQAEWNLTLGKVSDKYYSKNETTSVSFNMAFGIGNIPYDEVPFFTVFLLYLGFGLPFFVLLVTLIYFTSKRIQRRCFKERDALLDDALDY